MAGQRACGSISGVTLIELLVTMAILALLLTSLAPAFHHLEQRRRIAGVSREFLSTLMLTRQAAIERSQRVTLCPSADGTTCLPEGQWHRGWLVFADLDRDREHDSGESVVSSHGRLDGVTLTSSRWRRRISFKPLGTAGGSNATFTLCAGGEADPRAIVLSRLGRARVSETRPGGEALECPESP